MERCERLRHGGREVAGGVCRRELEARDREAPGGDQQEAAESRRRDPTGLALGVPQLRADDRAEPDEEYGRKSGEEGRGDLPIPVVAPEPDDLRGRGARPGRASADDKRRDQQRKEHATGKRFGFS